MRLFGLHHMQDEKLSVLNFGYYFFVIYFSESFGAFRNIAFTPILVFINKFSNPRIFGFRINIPFVGVFFFTNLCIYLCFQRN